MSSTAFKMAGQQLGNFFAREGVKKVAKEAATEAAIGITLEQGLPRALGKEAQIPIGETLVRQATGGILGAGVARGLKTRLGVPKRLAGGIGLVTGQLGGQQAAQALLPGHQQNPFTDPTGAVPYSMEPESAQVPRANTFHLTEKQQAEAYMEQMKYEHRLALAQVKNQPHQATVHHSNPAAEATAQYNASLGMLREGYSSRY